MGGDGPNSLIDNLYLPFTLLNRFDIMDMTEELVSGLVYAVKGELPPYTNSENFLNVLSRHLQDTISYSR